jgi:hypothetical protein
MIKSTANVRISPLTEYLGISVDRTINGNAKRTFNIHYFRPNHKAAEDGMDGKYVFKRR